MYSLVSAYGRAKGVSNQWKQIDAAGVTVYSLYQLNEEVYLVLTNPLQTQQQLLKMSDVKSQYRHVQSTVTDWLAGLGNTSLPTVAGAITINASLARYTDAVFAGYKINTIADDMVLVSNSPDEERHHIAFTRADTSYSDLTKYCLAVVNGLIHRLDNNSQMAVVYNANKHARRCRRYELGLLSFKTLGEIKCVPITAEMISRRHANTPLSNKLYITVNDEYADYSPMLVLGGYLYPADPRTFYNVGTKTYCLETGRISYIARFMEAREFGGYDVPTLDTSPTNERMVSVEQLLSDEKIIEVATAMESFLVFVKNKNLYYSREMLAPTKIPMVYKVPTVNYKRQPAFAGFGMMVNYWPRTEDDFMALKTSFVKRMNYNFLTTTAEDQFAVDDIGYSSNPDDLNDVFFLTIGSDQLSITEV